MPQSLAFAAGRLAAEPRQPRGFTAAGAAASRKSLTLSTGSAGTAVVLISVFLGEAALLRICICSAWCLAPSWCSVSPAVIILLTGTYRNPVEASSPSKGSFALELLSLSPLTSRSERISPIYARQQHFCVSPKPC